MAFEDLRQLFREINLLCEKYQQRKDSEEVFNVFTMLMKQSDEVNLHSRFISSLLDPEGPHRMGLLPLHLFLEAIGSKFEFGRNCNVTPNNYTWSEYKEIDVLIRDPQKKNAIILENKIYHHDSNHEDRGQLEGYYQQILNDGYESDHVEVYYLTLDCHEPSEESVNTNGRSPELGEKVQCIGYDIEIKNWLESLIKETYNHPFLRETINQYLKLIKKMTNNIDFNEQEDLTAIVGKNVENLAAAKYLIENQRHIFWHAIDSFRKELTKSFEESGLRIIESAKRKDIDIIVHGGPRERKEASLYWNVEENQNCTGLIWSLDCECDDDNGLYMGLYKSLNTEIDKNLKDNIDNYVKTNELPSNDDWFYWKYISDLDGPCLYFWDFTAVNTDTFDLINPVKRKAIIDRIVEIVKGEMREFHQFCSTNV